MARSVGAMHVATIRRRHGEREYESHLIRRSFRKGTRVRHETIANVSKLPPAALEALRRALAGQTLVDAQELFEIERSLPHGHVAAVLAACRRLEPPRLLDRAPSRERSLVVAMVVQRLLEPGSKLACVLRTSVTAERLDDTDVVRAYKQLKEVERDFRTLKGPQLAIRPIHHHLEQRVRAHVFLCMLALYLEWHLRQTWRELTFHDEQPPRQADPVAKATRSAAARRKAATKTTSAGQPAHTLRSLLAELRLQTRNTIRVANSPASFTKLTNPTPLQARALELAETITIE